MLTICATLDSGIRVLRNTRRSLIAHIECVQSIASGGCLTCKSDPLHTGRDMPKYRRARVPGASYFFTVVTHNRTPLFRDAAARRMLRGAFQDCLAKWPFTITAIVLLPDHLHTIWTLPPGDDEYSRRWNLIKKEFTKRWLAAGGREAQISEARRREHRRGVWQPRFWEHILETDDDFERHFDYIHYNPVKHGHARCPVDWPWSSFHRWVRAGVYPKRWAYRADGREFAFDDIEATARE